MQKNGRLDYRVLEFDHEDIWHKWRQKGVGASDVPIILGLSPHKTRSQLLIEKVTGKEKQLNEYASRVAAEGESLARALVNQENNLDLRPVCVEAQRNKYMRASLDGYCADPCTILEHKCISKAKFDKFMDMPHPKLQDTIKDKDLRPYFEQLVYQAGIVGAFYVKQLLFTYSVFGRRGENRVGCIPFTIDKEAQHWIENRLTYQRYHVRKFWKEVCDAKGK